jgi:hypothetical protein
MEARARWGIDWERIPWTLWAYVAVAAIDAAVLVTRSAHPKPGIFLVIVLVFWGYFLLRAVWWVWILTAALLALGVVIDLATQNGSWWGDATGVLQLALLVLPPTRRFFDDRAA